MATTGQSQGNRAHLYDRTALVLKRIIGLHGFQNAHCRLPWLPVQFCVAGRRESWDITTDEFDFVWICARPRKSGFEIHTVLSAGCLAEFLLSKISTTGQETIFVCICY